MKAKLDNTQQINHRTLCKEIDETVDQTIIECRKLAQKEIRD